MGAPPGEPGDASKPPRTVVLSPPSARAETWAVVRALFHIAYWSALVVSAQAHASGRAPAASDPSPFERRFQDLPSADQRLFRSLQEGIVEAERLRSATGRWPAVAALAERGVPPFAPDPLDRARYGWQRLETGTKVDYVGTPAPGSGREGMFAVIVEPDPGSPPDPTATPDEIHHRLDDGTMIHVTLWMGPPLAAQDQAFSLLPPEKGYRQVVAGTGQPAP
jgi:hypothetical protein